jgi:hypothetical protein
VNIQLPLGFFFDARASSEVTCKCKILHILSPTIRLHELQSKVLVPQLLVSPAGFKLVSAIKVL